MGRAAESPLTELAYRATGSGFNTDLRQQRSKQIRVGWESANPSLSDGERRLALTAFHAATRDEISVLASSGTAPSSPTPPAAATASKLLPSCRSPHAAGSLTLPRRGLATACCTGLAPAWRARHLRQRQSCAGKAGPGRRPERAAPPAYRPDDAGTTSAAGGALWGLHLGGSPAPVAQLV